MTETIRETVDLPGVSGHVLTTSTPVRGWVLSLTMAGPDDRYADAHAFLTSDSVDTVRAAFVLALKDMDRLEAIDIPGTYSKVRHSDPIEIRVEASQGSTWVQVAMTNPNDRSFAVELDRGAVERWITELELVASIGPDLVAALGRISPLPGPTARPEIASDVIYSEEDYPLESDLLRARGSKAREHELFKRTGGWQWPLQLTYQGAEIDVLRLDTAILRTRKYVRSGDPRTDAGVTRVTFAKVKE